MVDADVIHVEKNAPLFVLLERKYDLGDGSRWEVGDVEVC